MSKFSKLRAGFQVHLVCGVLLLNILVQGVWAENLFYFPSPLVEITENVTTEKPPVANLCPEAEKILPCWCSEKYIECTGNYIVQESIDRLMTELRVVNAVAQDQILFTTKTFYIRSTPMTSLDLTPLLKSHLTGFYMIYNHNLAQIYGPLSSSNSSFDDDLENQYFASIDTKELSWYDNNLTDARLADCFNYFSPSLEILNLRHNPIEGPSAPNVTKPPGTEFTEFLPGISNFNNLQTLELYDTKIRLLEGAPFKALGSLRLLEFDCVEEVGEDAFLMDGDGVNSASERAIVIEKCGKLNDNSFSVNHGLQLWGGKTTLNLIDNNFEFLSQEKFEPFLQINEANSMELKGNPFVCDQRMKWLKDGRESYEGRVNDVDCTNDPGHTVFTTDLV